MAKSKVFIGYAHNDRAFADTLLNYLTRLEQQEQLEVWDETKMNQYEDWQTVLFNRFAESHTIILLVSRYLLNSPFIQYPTVLEALRQAYLCETRVVPIILSTCNWSVLDFCKAQVLPKGFVPIERTLYPSRTWTMIAKRIEEWSNVACTEQLSVVDKLQVKLSYLATSNSQNTNNNTLVGRQHHFNVLDHSFQGDETDIVGVIAGTGVGKTALVNGWLKRCAPYYGRAKRVFGWSFYSQQANSLQCSSALFFEKALPFFGHYGVLPPSEEGRARRLVELLQDRPSILVLDGLEALQVRGDNNEVRLTDVAMQCFLYAVQKQCLGKQRLVILTSQFPVTELNYARNYRRLDLENLSAGESAHFLKILGVKGTPWQLMPIARAYSGHALALLLLGSLLVESYAGEVSFHAELPYLRAEEGESGQALRIIRFYDERGWSEYAPERTFLQLLGLFDRPMSLSERNSLLQHTELAAPLQRYSEIDWANLHTTLIKLGMLYERKQGSETVYETHPLIREYFAQQLRERTPLLWQQAHQILSSFFYNQLSTDYPSTLHELEPLYRAVHHSCLAGEYQAALNLYQDRLLRGSDYYSTRYLGAYSLDLALLRNFFEADWELPFNHDLNTEQYSWLLAQASFYLLSLGRLEECLIPQQKALQLHEQAHNWKSSANVAINHIDLLHALGRFTEALTIAERALVWAENSQDKFIQLQMHAKYGKTLHLMGQLNQSRLAFEAAEALQALEQNHQPLLYSVNGAEYADLLLTMAQDSNEREIILARNEYALTISLRELGLLSVAFDQWMHGKILNELQREPEAIQAFDAAVATLRKANVMLFLPQLLLTRGQFNRMQNNLEQARTDLEEACEISQRCQMRRCEVDAYLLEAHLLLDERREQINQINPRLLSVDHSYNDYSFFKAEQAYQKAESLIQQTRYHLRLAELSLLAARLAYYMHQSDLATTHLELARERIMGLEQWQLLAEWDRIKIEVS